MVWNSYTHFIKKYNVFVNMKVDVTSYSISIIRYLSQKSSFKVRIKVSPQYKKLLPFTISQKVLDSVFVFL